MEEIKIECFVNDAVHGRIGLTKIEKQLIDTGEFRRLKGIKQLSFGQVKYPSATHTRYNHCIGTLFVTNRYIDTLRVNVSAKSLKQKLEKNVQLLRIGALLHDIGHSAFSHSVEQALREHIEWYGEKIDHEYFTKKIILDHKKDIYKILKNNFSDDDIKIIVYIATGNLKGIDPNLRFLVDILTGDFGSDRVDYLLRDSHHAGLAYGKIEFEQLVSELCIKKFADSNRLCIKYDDTRIGIHASTALELGRCYHFSSLVFQPEIRCLNVLLKLLIEEYLENIHNKKLEINKFYMDYNDPQLLQKLEHFKFKKIKNATLLLQAIKETQTDNFYINYENIDDLLPQLVFLLYIILQDKKIYYKFRSEIEEEIRKKNKLDSDQCLTFDININGKNGLPTEMYIDVENYRSVFVSDKSPLLTKLAEHLTTIGSVSIFSTKKLNNINFNHLLWTKAKTYVQKVRKGKTLSEEYLLKNLYYLCEKREKDLSFHDHSQTDFKRMFPA